MDTTQVKIGINGGIPAYVPTLIIQNTSTANSLLVAIDGPENRTKQFTLPANTGNANPLSRLELNSPEGDPMYIRYLYLSGSGAATTYEYVVLVKQVSNKGPLG